MQRWIGTRLLVSMVGLGFLAGGCAAVPDRAGGDAAVQHANFGFADPTDAPPAEIGAWFDAVDKYSRGTFTFDVHSAWDRSGPDFEARTIRDVVAGRIDMGWVGARAFDSVGVTDFQPLLAPFLIDSLDLEGRVFEAGIPQEMLAGAERAGVVAVAVLPGPMRKMLGVAKPFTKPSDFAGTVVGIQASRVADWTFRALGATAKEVPPEAKLSGVDGYEQQQLNLMQYELSASAVTGNLNFWPRPLVVIMNRDAYARLSDTQRSALTNASRAAVSTALEAARNEDADGAQRICTSPLPIVAASAPSLAALRKAVQPVYDKIAANGRNGAILSQIEHVKGQLSVDPDSVTCPTTPPPTSDSPIPEGRYRMMLTHKETSCLAPDEHRFGELVFDLTLDQGEASVTERQGGPHATPQPAFSGRYRVFRDRIEFPGSIPLALHWSIDGRRLTFSDLKGGLCGDREVWTTHPWVLQ